MKAQQIFRGRNMRFSKFFTFLTAIILGSTVVTAVQAGPVFLTGHDPDFHSQYDSGAATLLNVGLNYATGGTYNTAGHKFLWIESNTPATPGHLVGENGLLSIGLVAGVNFDQVNAAGLASVDFSNYSAIAIASTFGGMLTQAELNALLARKTDIASFINSGGGLFAAAECGIGFVNCDSSNITDNASLFAFLPVTVNSASTTAPYTVTAFGSSLGLDNSDVNDPTHNSFSAIGGLNIVDKDAAGIATTLAGIVNVTDTGFTSVPEPGSIALTLLGLFIFGTLRKKKQIQ
ncbi:MAG: PEP-CTERM sorting domain-containing protein [Burkholderiaceae bacterium]